MSTQIIDGKKLADEIRAEVAARVGELKSRHGITPGLAVVLAGENPGSMAYVRSKGKACEKAGIYSRQISLPADVPAEQLISLVNELNNDPRIHGILVQLPLPGHIDEHAVISAINPAKDVDGFHPVNVGKLLIGLDGLRPCTPLGIVKLLEWSSVDTAGAHVVIVGRSNIVGKPLAAMLMQKAEGADATVTVCHSRSRNLSSITRQADILVAAIGRPEMITADMVGDDAVVIDVGMNRVEDPGSEKGYRLVGDVKFDEVAPKCRAITPVPGGVGRMTIAMLLHNTVQAASFTV